MLHIEQTLTLAFQIILWVIAIWYFSSSGIMEEQIMLEQINENWIIQISQAIITSPNCLAYEKFETIPGFEDKKLIGIKIISQVKSGVIDLQKFKDKYHQNCIRFNTLNQENKGEFLTYEVKLTIFKEGKENEELTFVSQENQKKAEYEFNILKEITNKDEKETKKYTQYLNCNTNFIKNIQKNRIPIKIYDNTNKKENFGVIEIKMCYGRQT